jgi:hypothetical protein
VQLIPILLTAAIVQTLWTKLTMDLRYEVPQHLKIYNQKQIGNGYGYRSGSTYSYYW